MIDLLKKWLNGTAKATDEQALERKAGADDFLADAMEGYRSMPEADHTKNIDALKAQLPQHKKRRGAGVIWWRIAAAAALVGVISTWVFISQNTDTIGIAANETAIEEVQKSDRVQEDNEISQTAPPLEPVSEESEVASELPTSEKQSAPLVSSPQAERTSESKKDRQVEDDLAAADEPTRFEAEEEAVVDSKLVEPAISRVTDQKLAISSSNNSSAFDSNSLSQKEVGEADIVTNSIEVQMDKALEGAPQMEPARAFAKKKSDQASKKREQAQPSISQDESEALVLRGTVFESASEMPLIGANVLIQGSNEGVITDFDGRFELRSEQDLPWVLELSYTGFNTQEVIVENVEGDLVLRMEEGGALLDEVVVTGYSGAPRIVEIDPRPKGGWKKFNRYLTKNLQYPESAKAQRLEGTVKLGFYINEQGRPEQFDIMQSLCEPCDQEAVRLLEEGPKWRGKKKRTLVSVEFNL